MSGLEPFAIVSAVSACSQLVDSLAELVTIITNAIKGVRYVPQYIRDLKSNVRIFEICLVKVIDASDKAYENDQDTKQARATAHAVSLLVGQGKKLRRKIHKLVQRTERDKFQMTMSQWLSKLGLAFKQSSVQCLQISLSGLVSNTQLLVCTVVMETLIAQIKELKRRKEPVPAHLEQQIAQLKQELKRYEEMAADCRREAQRQARESMLQKELVVELANLRELNHCLRKKVAKAVPERRHRSWHGEATQHSASSSSSRRSSHLVSSRSSRIVPTTRVSPSGVGRPFGQSSQDVRERTLPRGTSPALPTIRPLFQVSRRNEETTQHVGAPGDEDVLTEQEAAEEVRDANVQQSIIGPVILVGEDNQVREVHREWHPDASTPQGDEIVEMNEFIPEKPNRDVNRRDRGHQGHHTKGTMSNIHNIEEQINSRPQQSENKSRKMAKGKAREGGSPSKEEASANSSTIDQLQQPRMRRKRGDIGTVDLFSQSKDKNEHEDTNKGHDSRYKPVPPFNSSDRAGRRRPNSQ